MNNNSKISFTSQIVPVSTKTFHKLERDIGLQFESAFPWVISTSVKGPKVYTKGVIDCTSCLIADGKEGLLMHLTPAYENNHNFRLVLGYLRLCFNLFDKNLHAVILGSKNTKKSLDIYNKFVQMLGDLGIPFSVLKNGKSPSHMAYNAITDEVFISNDTINNALKYNFNNQNVLNNAFEKVSLCSKDTIK